MEKSSVSSKHSDHQSYPSFAVDSRLPQPTETRPVNPTTAMRLSGLPAMGSARSHPEFLNLPRTVQQPGYLCGDFPPVPLAMLLSHLESLWHL